MESKKRETAVRRHISHTVFSNNQKRNKGSWGRWVVGGWERGEGGGAGGEHTEYIYNYMHAKCVQACKKAGNTKRWL